MNALTLIAIVGIAVIGFMLFNNRQANAKQPETNVSPNSAKSTTLGTQPDTNSNSALNTKRNIITSNIVPEDLIRKLATGRTGAQGLEIFEDENMRISIAKAFKPIGDADITNPLSKNAVPLPKNFVGRTKPTFQIVTQNIKTGQTKTRIGSAALAKRLQENALRNR